MNDKKPPAGPARPDPGSAAPGEPRWDRPPSRRDGPAPRARESGAGESSRSDQAAPAPSAIRLHKRSGELEIEYADGSGRRLPAEFLRVHSPSAEVTGHSPGEGVLVTGKETVMIDRVEPIGRYAVRLVFDDGHDTGLYTWPILYGLCRNYEEKWRRYLDRLAAAGVSRNDERE